MSSPQPGPPHAEFTKAKPWLTWLFPGTLMFCVVAGFSTAGYLEYRTAQRGREHPLPVVSEPPGELAELTNERGVAPLVADLTGDGVDDLLVPIVDRTSVQFALFDGSRGFEQRIPAHPEDVSRITWSPSVTFVAPIATKDHVVVFEGSTWALMFDHDLKYEGSIALPGPVATSWHPRGQPDNVVYGAAYEEMAVSLDLSKREASAVYRPRCDDAPDACAPRAPTHVGELVPPPALAKLQNATAYEWDTAWRGDGDRFVAHVHGQSNAAADVLAGGSVKTRALDWFVPIGTDADAHEKKVLATTLGSVAVEASGRVVYAVVERRTPTDDQLVARSVESGALLWSADLEPGTTGLSVKNGRVYVAHRADVLVFTAKDGTMLTRVATARVFSNGHRETR